VFWYLGLIPDLATLRDRFARRGERGPRARLFSFLSLGWEGRLRHWSRYELVYLLLAGLATPLVLSVHSIVSFDFATSVIPGWHTTIFPPYFVAGAIFSGIAMVLTLMLVARRTMRLEDYLTRNHVDTMCKLVLATSWMVALAYGTELFTAFWSGNAYEIFAFENRMAGPMAWSYWIMVTCNVVVPQLFWSRRLRRNLGVVFAVSILVNVGMWFERFVIIVTSLHRDYLPSSWASYAPTAIEIATLAGTFGLFFTCFLLFCRFLPVIAMGEVKGVLSWGAPGHRHAEASGPAFAANAGRRGRDAATTRFRDGTRRYLVATFADEAAVARGVAALRRAGHPIRELFAPYAAHGLERLAGIRPSRLGWVCATAGLATAGGMYLFQVWTSATSWPLDVGGKPLVSWPAFVPVVFESGVLAGSLAVVAALFVRCRLWPGKRARCLVEGSTDDRFVVVVEEADGSFVPARVAALCREQGAVAVEERVLERL
jgi:hypothetical protein